jgi:serine/threonine-protein kinase
MAGTLNRYKLLEEVGQGGMAVVYKGFDTTLNREVAVKVLHPHLAGIAESRARLQREAHAVAKLRHENILEIFDYSGPDSPESYIVTEFIHGKTLKNFLAEHPLPFPEVAQMICSEVCRALEHAHGLGVIHRDIKPENVMIRDDGLVKLMDFGIAQIVDKERMTVTGQLLGSPAYMAPEHVEGKPLGFSTDVFAVGILLYQLATGQLPFRGKNPHEVLKKIAECKYQPSEMVNPKIGARLGRTIGKALKRLPDERFPDVAPMRVELDEDLRDAGVENPRKELAGFFADPEGWTRSFKLRMVAALAATGKERRKKGRTAAALELWSRALAYDPKSAELRSLVEGVARRQTLGRVAIYALGGACLIGVAALGAKSWHSRPIDVPAPVIIKAPVAPTPAPTSSPAVPEHAPTEPVAARGKPVIAHAAHPKIKTPEAAAHAALKTIELAPIPRNVKVFIDGADKGAYSDGRYQLDERPHQIRLESDYCFPKTLTVEPSKVSGPITARLQWKAARLIVMTKPTDADVVIDDSVIATPGAPIEIKIPELSDDGRRQVSVAVSAKGFTSRTLNVPLRANERHQESVVLEKREP